jgi:hypothetical protein
LTGRIRFHPAARDEFREAIIRYEAAQPGLGNEFRLEVTAYVERAATRELPGTPAASRRGHPLRKLALHPSSGESLMPTVSRRHVTPLPAGAAGGR